MGNEIDLLNEKHFNKRDIKEYNLLQFNIVNPSYQDQTIDLFYPYSSTPVPQQNLDCTPTTVGSNASSFPFFSISCYDSANNYVWTAQNVNYGAVVRYFDANTKLFIGSIATPANFKATSIAYSPTSKLICLVGYVQDLSPINTILFFNAQTFTYIGNVMAVCPVPVVCYNANKNTFYVASGGQYIYEVNVVAGTPTLLATITAPSSSSSLIGIAFDSTSGFIYATDNFFSTIVKINCTTNAIVNTTSSGISAPFYIGINTTERIAYVGSLTTSGLWIYNLNADLAVANIANRLGSPFDSGKFSNFLYYPTTNRMYCYDSVSAQIALVNPDFSLFTSLATNSGFPTPYPQMVLSTSNNQVIMCCFTSLPDSGYQVLSWYSNNPVAAPTIYITGTDVYDLDISDWKMNPVIVPKILLYSDKEENIKQNIDYVYTDSFGNYLSNNLFPSLGIDITQAQRKFTTIDFGDAPAIFGLYQYFKNFLVKANSTILMVLVFHQTSRKNLLMNGMTACSGIEYEDIIQIPKLEHIERADNDVCSQLDIDANRVPQLIKGDELKYLGSFNKMTQSVRPFDIGEFISKLKEQSQQ